MGKVSRFEDLEVWKSARSFSKLIVDTTLKISFSKDFSHKDQINRSSGLTMDNIAENAWREIRERTNRGIFYKFLQF